MLRRRLVTLICVFLVITPAFASDVPQGIAWQTVDAGGGVSKGGMYEVMGTVGQHDAGVLRGGIYQVHGGFWLPKELPTTQIVLAYLFVEALPQGWSIRWGTTVEQDTTLFRVLRASQNDRAAAVEIATVASQGSQGGDYQVSDLSVASDAWYWLVEVERDGATTVFGPVRAASLTNSAARVYLPLISAAR